MDRLGDGSRAGLRRPVHPDVGVLPRPERGRVRHRDQPGPADRVREAARARGRRSRLIRGRCARLPSRDGSTARARHPDHRLDRHRRRDGGPVRGRGRLRVRRLALGRPRSCPRRTTRPCRGGGRMGRRRPGRCGCGRRRGPCRRPAVRAAGRRLRGGRRERPAVRRRADPRADARGLGSDHRAQPAEPGDDLPGGRPPDAGPGTERLRHPRLDPADGQRHRHRPLARDVRDARLRGREGRDERAHDDDGRDVCQRADPGQCRRAVADRHADGRPAPRATRRSVPTPHGSSRWPARCSTPTRSPHAAVYFLSDESRAVTGQLLKVDGGWSVVSVSPEPAP